MKKTKKTIRSIISILLVLLMVTPFATIANAATGYLFYNQMDGYAIVPFTDTYGSSVTVREPSSYYPKVGTAFAGWSTSRNGSVSYYPGDTYNLSSYADVLYARYGYYGFYLKNTSSYIELDKTYRPQYTISSPSSGTKYEFSFVTGSSIPANGCIFQWYGTAYSKKGNAGVYFNSSKQLVVSTYYNGGTLTKTFDNFTFKTNTYYYITLEFLNDFNGGVISGNDTAKLHPFVLKVYDTPDEGYYGMIDPIYTGTRYGFYVDAVPVGTTILGASSSSDFKVAPNILLCSFKANRGIYYTETGDNNGKNSSGKWGTSSIGVKNKGYRNASASNSSINPTYVGTPVTVWTINNENDYQSPTVFDIYSAPSANNYSLAWQMDDNELVDGYYFGKSSSYSSNTFHKTGGDNKNYASEIISSPGTYYITARDISGNVSSTYSRTYYQTSFNANGGSVSIPYKISLSGSNTITLPTPTRSGYTCLGWSKSSTATTATYTCGSNYTVSGNTTLYAVWKSNTVNYTVSYNANGGSVSPSSATVASGSSVTLPTPTRSGYTCLGWSTLSTATTATYSCGSSYKPTANTTLYAVWKQNTTYYTVTYSANGGSVSPSSIKVAPEEVFTLPTPTRSGYTCLGWATTSTATTAEYACGSKCTTSRNVTLYAVWKQNTTTNIYNLGEETYSFKNFGDTDSPEGHCFGMSITSSGYYMGKLNVSNVGISSCQKVNTLSRNDSKVLNPICSYQSKQGPYMLDSIKVGGSGLEKNNGKIVFNGKKANKSSDWNAMISLVKNHNYDNKGSLQLLIWGYYTLDGKEKIFSGHATNFLYYKVVDGQERLYAYDNNFPNTEVYFYKASDGKIYERPYESLNVSIETLSFNSVEKYFELVQSYNAYNFVYAKAGEVDIKNAVCYPMIGDLNGESYVMYELPKDANEVVIVPLVENATFSYAEEEYNFNKVEKDTVGVLTVAGTGSSSASVGKLEITKADRVVLAEESVVAYYKNRADISELTSMLPYVESTNNNVVRIEGDEIVCVGKGSADVVFYDDIGLSAVIHVKVKYSFFQWLIIILLFGWLWY